MLYSLCWHLQLYTQYCQQKNTEFSTDFTLFHHIFPSSVLNITMKSVWIKRFLKRTLSVFIVMYMKYNKFCNINMERNYTSFETNDSVD